MLCKANYNRHCERLQGMVRWREAIPQIKALFFLLWDCFAPRNKPALELAKTKETVIPNPICLSSRFAYSFIVCLTVSNVFAQSDQSTETTPSEKKATTYLGVQANQLIRQIFNFSNSNSAIDNPYLFIYSVNSKQTGVGFSSGLGYSVSQITDGDASNKRETKINNFSLRVGVEKKSSIGKKWLVSWGFDITHDNLKNETINTQSFGPNNVSKATTTNTTSSWGFGPRFTLNFQVTNRILLATEANYYYKSGTTATTSSVSGQFSNSKTETSSDFTKFQFTLPAVIYLIVKF